MVDLQSQIYKIDLPEGLDELMGDITREVLRAQPDNIHGFIAHYLGALLRAREALSVAADLSEFNCLCTCEPDLDNGINNDDSVTGNEDQLRSERTSTELEKKKSHIDIITEHKLGCSNDVETDEDDANRLNQSDDNWTPSMFSLAGSYVNLPISRPYSVHDSEIIEDSKLVVRTLGADEVSSSSSDYQLSNICEIVPEITSHDSEPSVLVSSQTLAE